MALSFERGFCRDCLFHQGLKRGHTSIPFNKRGNRPKTLECLAIQRPDSRGNPGPVVVDAYRPPVVEMLDAMAGEMDFANRCRRQGAQVACRIPSVIACTDVDIVDVTQDAATGTLHDRCKELPLGNG